MIRRTSTLAGAGLLALFAAGCRSEPPRAKRTVHAASAKPLDHLAPGELAPSQLRVFGLEIPRGMSVRGSFSDVAYLEGDVAPEALANYVRDRVEVENVEIGAARTVFANARIKSGAPERSYQLEIVAKHGQRSELVIHDTTPPPVAPYNPSESDAERWRKAGRDPNGKPFDIKDLR